MKVLHVLNELKPSGAETMLRSAAPYWKEHGFTCELLATGSSEGEFAETLRKAGYVVHHLPRQRSATYFLDFRRLVRNGGYSLVHQHAEGASYWFGLAAMSGGAKVVRTMHSNFSFDGNLRWRRALQRRHLQALGTRFAAIAPGVQENERQRFGISSDLVWNWIDTDRFRRISSDERASARKRWGFKEQETVLVTVGNCSTVKNHGVLIEALARMQDMNHVRYLHIGLEDKNCSERLLAERLGVSERINFCGWLPNARDALAAADLYVMPSLYEGLGISALEALGVGLPSLLAEVNGLRDLRSLFPGLLYTAPEPDAIVQTIRAFDALGFEERRNISAKYSELVQEKFNVARGVREYSNIYRLACGPQEIGRHDSR